MTDDNVMPSLRMAKELKDAVKHFNRREARYLVDLYYQMQENRMRAAKQIKGIERGADDTPGSTHLVLDWFAAHAQALENQVKLALSHYAKAHKTGVWAMSQMGCGPVITAGLLAHFDIERAPTVGHFWSLAGLDPNKKWEKGKKRPWNMQLKCLCTFKLGECFVKVSNKEDAFYGGVYKERKTEEWARNLAGDNAAAAKSGAQGMEKAKKTTSNAYKWYCGRVSKAWAEGMVKTGTAFPEAIPKAALDQEDSQPMVPPAQVHARARRYAVKLFLAHFHEVCYRDRYGEAPPLPYPVAQLDHAHVIPVPGAA